MQSRGEKRGASLAHVALAVVVAVGLLTLFPTMRDARAAFPGDNGRIAFADLDGIFTMNPDGTERTQLTDDNAATRQDSSPTWSPDGTKIAFTHSDGSVHVMNAGGTEQTSLAGGSDPAWSPDGTKLVFVRYRDGGDRALYVMNADGTEQTKLTEGVEPAWSPDGTKIAFSDCREGFGIFVLRLKDSKVERLTRASTDCTGYEPVHQTPSWSPDGSKLAFAKMRYRSAGEIFTINADGTGLNSVPIPGSGGGYQPAWSPDGEKIVYYNLESIYTVSDDGSGIYTMNPDGTEQRAVAEGHPRYPDWGVAPGATLLPPPPTTFVTSGPATGSEITSRSATFEFTSDKEGSTFECSLDNGAFESCSSPKTFTRLTAEKHVFRVRATDASGRIDVTPVSRPWTVPPPNKSPEARDDRFSVKKDKTLTVRRPGVLKNDRDPEDGRLTAGVISRPEHGKLNLRSDGSFVYESRNGYHGRDGFRYEASDGKGGTSTAKVRIVVRRRS